MTVFEIYQEIWITSVWAFNPWLTMVLVLLAPNIFLFCESFNSAGWGNWVEAKNYRRRMIKRIKDANSFESKEFFCYVVYPMIVLFILSWGFILLLVIHFVLIVLFIGVLLELGSKSLEWLTR